MFLRFKDNPNLYWLIVIIFLLNSFMSPSCSSIKHTKTTTTMNKQREGNFLERCVDFKHPHP